MKWGKLLFLIIGFLVVILIALNILNNSNIKESSNYLDDKNIDQYYSSIERSFALTKDQYTLRSMNSTFERGGFVEAQGDYKLGGKFELFNRWGWCSSGGADCGWTKCFAVEGNDELFEIIVDRICNELSSQGRHDEHSCSYSQEYDTTDEIRQRCLGGEYNEIIGNKRIISVIQIQNRCSSSVKKGSSECLKNIP